jgi:hypothetical protein
VRWTWDLVCASGACNRAEVDTDPRWRFGFVGVGARRLRVVLGRAWVTKPHAERGGTQEAWGYSGRGFGCKGK